MNMQIIPIKKIRDAFAEAAKTRDEAEALEQVAQQFDMSAEAVAQAVREVAEA